MMSQVIEIIFQINPERYKRMIDIRDERLFIDNVLIGGEKRIMELLRKAKKYDQIKANFEKGGESQ